MQRDLKTISWTWKEAATAVFQQRRLAASTCGRVRLPRGLNYSEKEEVRMVQFSGRSGDSADRIKRRRFGCSSWWLLLLLLEQGQQL